MKSIMKPGRKRSVREEDNLRIYLQIRYITKSIKLRMMFRRSLVQKSLLVFVTFLLILAIICAFLFVGLVLFLNTFNFGDSIEDLKTQNCLDPEPLNLPFKQIGCNNVTTNTNHNKTKVTETVQATPATKKQPLSRKLFTLKHKNTKWFDLNILLIKIQYGSTRYKLGMRLFEDILSIGLDKEVYKETYKIVLTGLIAIVG